MNLTILLYVFIGSFILLTLGFWLVPTIQGDKFLHYVNLISVFSTLAIVSTFLINLKSQGETARQAKIDKYSSETQRYEFDLQNQFIQDYPYLTRLYAEINPRSNIIIPVLTSEQQNQAKIKEYMMTRNLFQIIENIIHTHDRIEPESSWWNTFTDWSNSSIFRSSWESSKKYYDKDTQKFIDGLISSGRKTATVLK